MIASIIGWQAISLILLGVITHQLWQNDYHLTFSRVVIIFTSWASILFVMWYIADLFDHSAGFERWLRAFNSRARVTPDADSVECVADALDMTRRYPEVLRYKQEVTSSASCATKTSSTCAKWAGYAAIPNCCATSTVLTARHDWWLTPEVLSTHHRRERAIRM